MRGTTTTIAATGTLMRKAQRHPGPSTSHPPTNGPIAPATPPSPDHAPTALARSLLRKLAWRIARLPGVSSAAPTPCSTRAADEHLDVRRGAAQQRRGREPDRADHEDLAPSVAIAERSTEQDQRREREQIAGEHPLQRADARVEVVADVRERDVDDRCIQRRHRARGNRGGRARSARPS